MLDQATSLEGLLALGVAQLVVVVELYQILIQRCPWMIQDRELLLRNDTAAKLLVLTLY